MYKLLINIIIPERIERENAYIQCWGIPVSNREGIIPPHPWHCRWTVFGLQRNPAYSVPGKCKLTCQISIKCNWKIKITYAMKSWRSMNSRKGMCKVKCSKEISFQRFLTISIILSKRWNALRIQTPGQFKMVSKLSPSLLPNFHRQKAWKRNTSCPPYIQNVQR